MGLRNSCFCNDDTLTGRISQDLRGGRYVILEHARWHVLLHGANRESGSLPHRRIRLREISSRYSSMPEGRFSCLEQAAESGSLPHRRIRLREILLAILEHDDREAAR